MFNRDGDSVLQYEKVLEVDGASSCPLMSMYLMPLNCTLKGVKMQILSYVYFITTKIYTPVGHLL